MIALSRFSGLLGRPACGIRKKINCTPYNFHKIQLTSVGSEMVVCIAGLRDGCRVFCFDPSSARCFSDHPRPNHRDQVERPGGALDKSFSSSDISSPEESGSPSEV